MATLKQRLHRKNAAGTYDTIHLETSADLVLMTDGSTKLSDKISSMDTAISGKAAASHTHTTISGNAGTATKLATARTIRTNLASTATASFDGSGNVTPGVTGTLGVGNGGTGVTSMDALKKALGIEGGSGTSGGSGGTSGSTTAGGTMTFDNMSWLVVDDGKRNSNERVLILKDIWCLMNGYNIERFVTYFWNYVLSPEARAKCTPHHFNEFGDRAFTIPCFVPTYTEVNGGFSHFNSNANRIANYNGSAQYWWTSSPGSGGDVYCVLTDGGLNGGYGPSTAYGFRPCVALKR